MARRRSKSRGQTLKEIRGAQASAYNRFEKLIESKCRNCKKFDGGNYYCQKWAGELKFGFNSVYEATRAYNACATIIKTCEEYEEMIKE
ncbi:MAG: hypothetical protein QMD21_03610 [Candidatus Thermoplasmatota archaeon]|nr:hypothetical protein [Candidatus Thermoplasmatota archaeon]MDI6855856.1 hypothetical protein [Candidatus Thermoplasmatota archaeon]